jgi:hypothetical protein
MAFGNASYNEILTTTFEKVHRRFVDNIFKARPLGFYLQRSGQVVPIDGGSSITEPLVGAENDTVQSYSAWDQLVVKQTEEVTSANFPWRAISATVSIAGLEEAQNSGEAAILDLLGIKLQVAEESLTSQLNTMFHADGTGNGGKDINGIADLLGQNATAVGGIDPSDADNSWWQTNLFPADNSGSFSHTNSTVLDRTMMSHAYNTASVGTDQPGFIMTTQDLFEFYESLLQGNVRYTQAEVGDAGFQTLVFKGKPVFYDEDNASGVMWFINPKYLRFKVHKDNFMKASPFIQPRDYDVRTMKMKTYGNLTVNNRSRHAQISALTTS